MSENKAPKTAGQRARLAAKKRGRLQISSVLPAITAAATEAASKGLFSVDVVLKDPWFMDKTNQRDLRRILKQEDLYAVNPREEDGNFVVSVAWGDFPPEESLFRPKPVEVGKAVIMVVNASSNVGKAALKELKDYTDLYTIKGTSRKEPSEELQEAFPHVEFVVSDLSKESLHEVTKGVDKIFYVMPPAENRVELAKNLAGAAAANNVQYLVDVSIVGAEYRAITFANQCRDAEEAFEASGVPFTHLRCSAWFENMLGSAGTIKGENKFYLPYGDGAIPMMAVADVGRAAARLITRMGAEGVVVEFTGPTALTGKDLAAALSEELGREIEYVSPPLEDWVQTVKGYGLEEWFADGLGELYGIVQKGMTANVSPDGPKLLGEMETFKHWVHQHREAFL